MTNAIDVLRAIERALQDHTAAEVLDENSPIRDRIRAALATPTAAPQEPTSWKLVPVEPNSCMLRAATECSAALNGRACGADYWKAMIEASQTAPTTLPNGWMPLVITHDGEYPEEVAYGPQIMMDRLKKWLDRYFAALTAPPEQEAQPARSVPVHRHPECEQGCSHPAQWIAGPCQFECVKAPEFAAQPAAQEPIAEVIASVAHLRAISVRMLPETPMPKVGDQLYTAQPAAQEPVTIRTIDDLVYAGRIIERYANKRGITENQHAMLVSAHKCIYDHKKTFGAF